MTIWLDMDGVLADFNKGYYDLAGFRPVFGHDTREVDWSIVDSFPGFFGALDPMPDARMLVQVVQHYAAAAGENCRVLTSLPRSQAVIVQHDKRDWLDTHFPTLLPRFCGAGEPKASHCAENDILIDDWPGKHRKEWEAARGRFIWHVNSADTIARLREWGYGK